MNRGLVLTAQHPHSRRTWKPEFTATEADPSAAALPPSLSSSKDLEKISFGATDRELSAEAKLMDIKALEASHSRKQKLLSGYDVVTPEQQKVEEERAKKRRAELDEQERQAKAAQLKADEERRAALAASVAENGGSLAAPPPTATRTPSKGKSARKSMAPQQSDYSQQDFNPSPSRPGKAASVRSNSWLGRMGFKKDRLASAQAAAEAEQAEAAARSNGAAASSAKPVDRLAPTSTPSTGAVQSKKDAIAASAPAPAPAPARAAPATSAVTHGEGALAAGGLAGVAAAAAAVHAHIHNGNSASTTQPASEAAPSAAAPTATADAPVAPLTTSNLAETTGSAPDLTKQLAPAKAVDVDEASVVAVHEEEKIPAATTIVQEVAPVGASA